MDGLFERNEQIVTLICIILAAYFAVLASINDTEMFWTNERNIIRTSQSIFRSMNSNTAGTCSPVTITKENLESCQDKCLLYSHCQSLTFQELPQSYPNGICTLHNCSKYQNIDNSGSTFYARLQEPYWRYTSEANKRGSCPEIGNYTLVDSNSDCLIECSRTLGCNGVTTQLLPFVCYIQPCDVVRSDKKYFQFRSKKATGDPALTTYDNGTTGDCLPINDKMAVKSVKQCIAQCDRNQDCLGLTIKYNERRCWKHSCTLSVDFAGERYRFLSRKRAAKLPDVLDVRPNCFYEYRGDRTTALCEKMSAFEKTDIDDCRDLCSKAWQCEGFTFDNSTSSCVLFPCNGVMTDNKHGGGLHSKTCQDLPCPYTFQGSFKQGACDSIFQSSPYVQRSEDCMLWCELTPGCEAMAVWNSDIGCYLHHCDEIAYTVLSNFEAILKSVDLVYDFEEFQNHKGSCHIIHQFQDSLGLNDKEFTNSCQQACAMNKYCESCTTEMKEEHKICFLHKCAELYLFDQHSTFYQKKSAVTNVRFNEHGRYTVPACEPYDRLLRTSIDMCKQRCTDDFDCKGITIIHHLLRCKLYQCNSFVPASGKINFFIRNCNAATTNAETDVAGTYNTGNIGTRNYENSVVDNHRMENKESNPSLTKLESTLFGSINNVEMSNSINSVSDNTIFVSTTTMISNMQDLLYISKETISENGSSSSHDLLHTSAIQTFQTQHVGQQETLDITQLSKFNFASNTMTLGSSPASESNTMHSLSSLDHQYSTTGFAGSWLTTTAPPQFSLSPTISSLYTLMKSEITGTISSSLYEITVSPLNETFNLTGQFCNCTCVMVEDAPLALILESLVAKVSVDKTKIKSRIRKRKCSPDDRPASEVIGKFGVFVIITTCLVLLVLDLPLYLSQIRLLANSISKFFRR